MGVNKKQQYIGLLKGERGKSVMDEDEKSESLNLYFASVFSYKLYWPMFVPNSVSLSQGIENLAAQVSSVVLNVLFSLSGVNAYPCIPEVTRCGLLCC